MTHTDQLDNLLDALIAACDGQRGPTTVDAAHIASLSVMMPCHAGMSPSPGMPIVMPSLTT